MVYKRTKKWLQSLLRPNGKSSASQRHHLGSSINLKNAKEFELTINVMTINYKDIKELDILSLLEIPVQHRELDLDTDTGYPDFLQRVLHLIELGLIDPKRVDEFMALTPTELGEFFGKWMQASVLTQTGETDEGFV